ncbi:cysteine desulfurase [Candidatus Nomurabacteria bacterium]|nr:cysteine desulfurase [Candidatus Kaiserbacteria bacterium]MCB9814140.1 cysteine desulfurase [Candidatus Nomurabacteria bacterium]
MSNSLDKSVIYLDHAASTPIDPEVLAVMSLAYSTTYGNPSSLHQIGRQAVDTLDTARTRIATTLEVKPDEIIFTGSGTESDNLAIIGIARANQMHGRHIVVSSIEHKAVLAAAHTLEKEGFSITYIKPDEAGIISVEAVLSAVTTDTILISIMYANNEIGTVQPIKAISEALKNIRPDQTYPIIHTDACQAPGMLPISPTTLDVDAMTLNGAKVYGPKGVGLLYLKKGIAIEPVLVGGGQEGGLRAGTESVPLILGFALALEKAVANTKKESVRLRSLQQFFIAELESKLSVVILNGHRTERLSNNINICIPDVEGESLVLLLDQANICCATGSACSAQDLEPSHVLRAIGRNDDIIHGSLRFSLGKSTTKKDLQYTVETLVASVTRLKSITASTVSALTKHNFYVSKT